MRDIDRGSIVIGGDGKPASVVDVFPQGIKDVYKIQFSDGTSAECGLDHLWKVQRYGNDKKRHSCVISLRDMLQALENKIPYSKNYRKMFAIDYVPSNVEFESKLTDSDIHPYVLGVLLGDGCFTHRNELLLSEPDKDVDIVERVNQLIPNNVTFKKRHNRKCDYSLVGKDINRNPNSESDLVYKLKQLGLWGKYSVQKFIPKKYLYASYNERLALLRGLCDTDGSSSNTNRQVFEVSCEQLALDFKELAMSLGCSATISKKSRSYKDKDGNKIICHDAYSVSFRPDFNPYLCIRKANRWKSYRQIRHKFIVNISLVRKEECKCIMLDNEDHTYITDDYTITHNTWLGLKFSMAAALKGERVGIYSGEMSKEQLQERILCCAKKQYTSTKEEALQFILDNNIDIKVLTQKELRRRATVDDIEEMIIRENLTFLVVDQLSLMEDNTSKPGTPIRQQYGNISMDLFSLSSKYHLPVILLVQSNRAGSDSKDGPQLENIAESDAVAQNATRVISMRNENGVLTMNILKNRYGDSRLVQKYDVDFGINKYKPIQDFDAQLNSKRAVVKDIFRNNRTF